LSELSDLLDPLGRVLTTVNSKVSFPPFSVYGSKSRGVRISSAKLTYSADSAPRVRSDRLEQR
jgi:hypothetical protein